MENLTQLNIWLSELLYRDNKLGDHFQFIKQDTKDECVVYFYTKDNRYYIVVKANGYFGCQVSTRKPRAGEDWNRGNDLPDGKFNEATWVRIKNAIISYELVKIAKKEKENQEKENPQPKPPAKLTNYI